MQKTTDWIFFVIIGVVFLFWTKNIQDFAVTSCEKYPNFINLTSMNWIRSKSYFWFLKIIGVIFLFVGVAVIRKIFGK